MPSPAAAQEATIITTFVDDFVSTPSINSTSPEYTGYLRSLTEHRAEFVTLLLSETSERFQRIYLEQLVPTAAQIDSTVKTL